MLRGKTAIVTGSASGIGKATAELFAQHGAQVCIADIDQANGEKVAASINSSGGKAIFVQTDVREPQRIENMVAAVSEELGPVDILCNNAADLSLLAKDDHLLNTDYDVWEDTFRADTLSAATAAKCVIPAMLERGSGVIVNVSSVDGIQGDDTRFGYAMAKSAMNMLTKMIATRYGKEGVRCNSVAPGLVLTPAATQLTPEMIKIFDNHTLSPKYGADPHDIASVIVFLSTEGACFINGQTIPVDGGLLNHVPYISDMRKLFAGSDD